MSSPPASPPRSADLEESVLAHREPPSRQQDAGVLVAWRLGRWSDADADPDSSTDADAQLDSRPDTSLTRLAAETRGRSATARAWLRDLVGDLGFAWHGLEASPPGTAPRLRAAPSSTAVPAVSISHSGAYVAVAVAAAGRIGIDVETHLWPFASAALVRRFCTPAEQASLDPLDPEERLLRLRELWAAKEARVKASGTGLGTDLRELPVLTELEGLDRRHPGASLPFAAALVHERHGSFAYSLLGEGHAVVPAPDQQPRSPR